MTDGEERERGFYRKNDRSVNFYSRNLSLSRDHMIFARLKKKTNFIVVVVAVVLSDREHLRVNDICSVVHNVRLVHFDWLDRTISVDYEIENERNNNFLLHNLHEIDMNPILTEKKKRNPNLHRSYECLPIVLLLSELCFCPCSILSNGNADLLIP